MDKTTMAILVMLAQRARRARQDYRKSKKNFFDHGGDEFYRASGNYYSAWVEANSALQCAKQVLNEMTRPKEVE